jgi:hypothetical protein
VQVFRRLHPPSGVGTATRVDDQVDRIDAVPLGEPRRDREPHRRGRSVPRKQYDGWTVGRATGVHVRGAELVRELVLFHRDSPAAEESVVRVLEGHGSRIAHSVR